MKPLHNCLFELGCEELPPKSLRPIMQQLKQSLEKTLAQAELPYQQLDTFATPRRIAVLISGLATQQADKKIERRGPAVTQAFDTEGQPTKACLGFAKSCQTTVAELQRKKTEKGEWLYYTAEQKGKNTATLLPDFFRQAIERLSLGKSMRWGDTDYRFLRPVRWLCCVLDDQPLEVSLFGLKSSEYTYGHRQLRKATAIKLETATNYAQALLETGYVIADYSERQACIQDQIDQLSKSKDLIVDVDHELAHTVNSIVEWPLALLIEFEERFLSLPSEVLITAMKSHQKCFPCFNSKGEIKPYFITIANNHPKSTQSIEEGNARVMRARLSDAAFFFKTDAQTPLKQRLEKLKSILFQAKLGTLYDKTKRLEFIATELAPICQADISLVIEAAQLCKCDLTTDMVGEFPELQGIMGAHYAALENYDTSIQLAIKSHYQPRFASDALPSDNTAICVAIADKIDTLLGIFSVGAKPTGEKDPYALRRAMLGLLKIMITHHIDCDLKYIIKTAKTAYEKINQLSINQTCCDELLNFATDRLKSFYIEQGYAADHVKAVLSNEIHNPSDFDKRLQAVQKFVELPQAAALSQLNKRVSNILSKHTFVEEPAVNESYLVLPEEKALFQCLEDCKVKVVPLLQKRDYNEVLLQLSTLDQVIAEFFEGVMVMAEEPQLKHNRLSLLFQLKVLFSGVATLSELQQVQHEASHS